MARAVSRRQGSAVAVAVAVAVLGLLSCCSLPLAHAQLSDKKVYNDKDFYNAFIDDSVGAIGLSYDGASLAPYAQALYKYLSASGANDHGQLAHHSPVGAYGCAVSRRLSAAAHADTRHRMTHGSQDHNPNSVHQAGTKKPAQARRTTMLANYCQKEHV